MRKAWILAIKFCLLRCIGVSNLLTLYCNVDISYKMTNPKRVFKIGKRKSGNGDLRERGLVKSNWPMWNQISFLNFDHRNSGVVKVKVVRKWRCLKFWEMEVIRPTGVIDVWCMLVWCIYINGGQRFRVQYLRSGWCWKYCNWLG